MSNATVLAEDVQSFFGSRLADCKVDLGEVTVTVAPEQLIDVARTLRDEEKFAFSQLMDLCAVDYQSYGETPWQGQRFCVVYHLLSIKHNRRLRVKVFASDDDNPRVDSVNDIWSSANWYEREAFDLFGILFVGHPDLRRILTDYGFIGHPFRKDFPLIGNVEMRYDPEKQRVVYEPVSIQERILVPRTIRHDNRYAGEQQERGS